MFDTVYFDQNFDCLGEHNDWYVSLNKPLEAEDNDGSPQFISAKHKDIKISLSGSLENGFTKVRVPSLAALLKGQNGEPLQGPKEVAAAFDVLDGLLSMVAKPKGKRSFTRVDISLNLDILYKDIEYGLWGSALKQGRKSPMIYPGESITFRRSETELKFYDKALRTKAKDIPGADKLKSFVRVELSLKGRDLIKEMGGMGSVESLDYMKCYRALRKHILEVAPATKAIDVADTDSFLAWLYRKDPSLLMPYLNRGGKAKSPSRRKKMREVARMAATIGEDEIPWSEILPEDSLPLQVQLFYPNNVKSVFHEGIRNHPPSQGLYFISDEDESEHQRLIKLARYRCGVGVDPSGRINSVPVDVEQLGRSKGL